MRAPVCKPPAYHSRKRDFLLGLSHGTRGTAAGKHKVGVNPCVRPPLKGRHEGLPLRLHASPIIPALLPVNPSTVIPAKAGETPALPHQRTVRQNRVAVNIDISAITVL
jgi:hypothetical protein